MRTLATRRSGQGPGAVAIIEISGDVQLALSICADPCRCATGDITLTSVPGIDSCLLARPRDDRLLMMPHGGEAIVRGLLDRLEQAGLCVRDAAPASGSDAVESAILQLLVLVRTDLALDLVLAQHDRWRNWRGDWTDDDDARSTRLNYLLNPPSVVVAGAANIGKSTLLNALAGECTVLVADTPGTTRDHVGRLLDLGGLVVEWIDTPGLRTTVDPAEAAAIELMRPRLQQAHCLIAAADAATDWPVLPRRPDLRLGLRSDLGRRHDADLCCSGATGDGLTILVRTVRNTLVTDEDLASERPWLLQGLDRRAAVCQRPMAE